MVEFIDGVPVVFSDDAPKPGAFLAQWGKQRVSAPHVIVAREASGYLMFSVGAPVDFRLLTGDGDVEFIHDNGNHCETKTVRADWRALLQRSIRKDMA